jgi:hypothetical protein
MTLYDDISKSTNSCFLLVTTHSSIVEGISLVTIQPTESQISYKIKDLKSFMNQFIIYKDILIGHLDPKF